MDKIEIFRKHLDMIKSNVIKDFTIFAMKQFPDYFWSLPASTSGRRHGGPSETLIDHIQGCLFMAEAVCDQFEEHWNQRQKDQLISAVILHDGWRCHTADGDVKVITAEEAEEREYLRDKVGNFRTSSDHPEAGYRQLLRISAEFNAEAVKNKTEQISAKDLSIILKAVRYHYGPWMEVPHKLFSLDWPYSSVVVQVHCIDYHNAKNACWYSK